MSSCSLQLMDTNLRQIPLQSSGIPASMHSRILAVYGNCSTIQKAHRIFVGLENHTNRTQNRSAVDLINSCARGGSIILREGAECMEPVPARFAIINDPNKRPGKCCGCFRRILCGKPIYEYGWDSLKHHGKKDLMQTHTSLVSSREQNKHATASYAQKFALWQEQERQRNDPTLPRWSLEATKAHLAKFKQLDAELDLISLQNKQYKEGSAALSQEIFSIAEGDKHEARQQSLQHALHQTKGANQVLVIAGTAHFDKKILQEFSNSSLMYVIFKP
jgi:hypothetical protein